MFTIQRLRITCRLLARSYFSIRTDPLVRKTDHLAPSVDVESVVRVRRGECIDGTGTDIKLRSKKRRKFKLNPREKYMLRKMRTRHRESTIGYLTDEVSNPDPLYELNDPWSGYSPLQKARSVISKKQGVLTKRQESLAESIGETIKAAQMKIKEQTPVEMARNNYLQNKGNEMRPVRSKLKPSFFKSAQYVKKLQNENVLGEFRMQREFLSEQIATKLHQRDLESTHEYLKSMQTSMSKEESKLNKALQHDPQFPQDAARIEAQSKELDDAEEWLDEIKTFAMKHEKVLDAMDTSKSDSDSSIDFSTSPQGGTPLGPLGDDLIKSMETNGINVDSLRNEALREIDREANRNKSR